MYYNKEAVQSPHTSFRNEKKTKGQTNSVKYSGYEIVNENLVERERIV